MVTTPSKETIDAALRLAEAVDEYEQSPGRDKWQEHEDRLQAYRATLPKLRTRAEVDAEIVAEVRRRFEHLQTPLNVGLLHTLCAEPTRDDSGPGEEPARRRVLFTPKTVPCSAHFVVSCPECYR